MVACPEFGLRVEMNPLDSKAVFHMELLNPNPTSSKTKDGPKYRVSFEMHKEDWQCFMDANTQGMVLEFQGRVTELNEPMPKGGPLSKEAGMLCQHPEYNEYAESKGYEDLKAMIYANCSITSRAQLDHDNSGAWCYNNLKSKMFAWCEAKKNEALRNAQ